jgi:hypothetical protein
MYFRRKTSGGRAYLQIVESRREGDQVRQQVIATIGRMDELRGSGELERLLRSGARFAVNAMVLSGAEDAVKVAGRRIGPALVFERLWEETGCRAVLSDLARARGHAFALERAVFLTVLHRLFVGGASGGRLAGGRTARSPAYKGSIRAISIGRWRGSARSCRRRTKAVECRSRGASRTLSRNDCSRIAATDSRGST